MAGSIEEPGWHLDKRVPISLILTLVVQTCGFIWWAASINGRVDQLEKDGEARSDEHAQLAEMNTKLAVLNSRFEYLEQSIDALLEASKK